MSIEQERKTKVTVAFTPHEIPSDKEVRVTEMKHHVEVLSLGAEPTGLLKIQRLDKERYLNHETGEIRLYRQSENRGQSLESIRRTFKAIRHIINNNFVGGSNELFNTLTYAENMTDTKRLYNDFEVYIKKIRRKYGDLDYMSIVEPQGRGAWHCHVLLRFNDHEKIFIKNEILADMWGHGFTKTSSLSGVDNIGAYLTAYLSDVDITGKSADEVIGIMDSALGETKVVEKEVGKVKKKFIKGGRLHMYPSGMNLYRCSRGIIKPETVKQKYSEVKEKVGSAEPNFSKTFLIDVNDRPVQSVTYEQYNLSRSIPQQK